uniref:Uncharacterized protein n=1 Tax=Lepeophtheirus salmonis TaxID=72036 RepID=A0A0K2SVZ4_LEPSM
MGKNLVAQLNYNIRQEGRKRSSENKFKSRKVAKLQSDNV